jgi:hypothetical protein
MIVQAFYFLVYDSQGRTALFRGWRRRRQCGQDLGKKGVRLLLTPELSAAEDLFCGRPLSMLAMMP